MPDPVGPATFPGPVRSLAPARQLAPLHPTRRGRTARRRSTHGRRAIASLLLCGVATTGCYRHVELTSPTPAPDTRIVAQVSPVGAEEMAGRIGADAVGIEALVTRWGDTEAELALLRVDHRGPSSVQWNRERVVFPLSTLRDVRERRLDTGRTAAFVSGLAAAATLLAVMFVRFVGPGDEGTSGPPAPPH